MDQFAWGSLGAPVVGVCGFTFLALTNLLAVVRYARRGGEERATSLSLAAWALSFFGYCLGPCGILTAVVALILASMERGKVSREEASAWTLVPCQAARTNAVVTILLMLVAMIYQAVYWYSFARAASDGVT